MQKTLLVVCFQLCVTFLSAQNLVGITNFEDENLVQIELGTEDQDTLWKIGEPQKVFINEALSLPNVIITETDEFYPDSSNASFTVKIGPDVMWSFPFIQLGWQQKIDTEAGVDGGFIEASYDNGLTWSNVLDSDEFRPVVAGLDLTYDTLFNNQAGFSGTRDWHYVALCWGTYFGNLPPATDSLFVRYTFVSDSTDTQQEGWAMDDFDLYVAAIGSTSNLLNEERLQIYPNPATDVLQMTLDVPNVTDVDYNIHDMSGKLVQKGKLNFSMLGVQPLSIHGLRKGVYTLNVQGKDFAVSRIFYKIK